MDLQEAFRHYRKESAAVAEQISRLIAASRDRSVSAQDCQRCREEMKALISRQDVAARMLLALEGRGTPRPIETSILNPSSGAMEAGADALGKSDEEAGHEEPTVALRQDATEENWSQAIPQEAVAGHQTALGPEATAAVHPSPVHEDRPEQQLLADEGADGTPEAAADREKTTEDPGAAVVAQEMAEKEHPSPTVHEEWAPGQSELIMAEDAAQGPSESASAREETAGEPRALRQDSPKENSSAPVHEDTGARDDWWNTDSEQAPLLNLDWSGLAERCAGTTALTDDPQILKDLSSAFNALFGSGDLSLAAGDALSFAEQSFSHMEYVIQQQKDGGWIVSAGGLQCENLHHLALAIYGAACLVLARLRNEIEGRTGGIGEQASEQQI